MSYFKPAFRHPELPTNKLGFTKRDYEGAISTLCAGCGHDSISNAIDNLLKGAAGQALQCINISMNLDHTTGLKGAF